MAGLDQLVRFVDVKLHPVELAQQVIGKFDVGLVDLIDQQHRLNFRIEGFPQSPPDDVVAYIPDPDVAQLRVAQA